MSWRTTVVEPVAPDRLTLMQVTCVWCPWSQGLFDTAIEEGRAAIRDTRLAHTCTSRDGE